MRWLMVAPLCFDPDGNGEVERRSRALLRLDPNAPAVHLDDALGDRQAETGAALLARDRAVGLLELLEDLGLIGSGDAGAGVADRNRERPFAAAALIATSPLSVNLIALPTRLSSTWE